MAKEISIINIFNRMSYNNHELEKTDVEKIIELYPDLKNVDITQSIRTAICIAKKTQNKNDGRPFTARLHQRALILQDIGRILSEEANRLSELQDFREKDYSLLIDFFNYYSNICYQFEMSWSPHEYIVVFTSTDVTFFILGAVISAAFAAGFPVIVTYFPIPPSSSPESCPWFLLFLKQVFSRTTLPESFFTLVPVSDSNLTELDETLPGKIVGLGQFTANERNIFASSSFVGSNNTSTIIFEFCDLNAAIDKIIQETWDRKLATMWGVSTAVVQESVYQKFLDKLKLRIDQLITDEQDRIAVKNSIISEEDSHRQSTTNRPVLKVLSCRTANEGVNFLNSTKYYLGTSIWSENSSQALEVASKLICKNVWINCHGIIDPSVPFQPSGCSGNEVVGGYEGVLEYATIPFRATIKNSEFNTEKIQVEETALSAQKAFEKWLLMENKEMYLTKIAQSLNNHTELTYLSDVIIEVLVAENRNPVPRRYNKNFYIIHEKFPIGVIAILVEDFEVTSLVYLITTALAFGNAVVLVLRENKKKTHIGLLVDIFNIHLPRGLLSVITEEEKSRAGISLACNTIIQALWLYPVTSFPTNYIKLIKSRLFRTTKRIWLIPDLSDRYESYQFIYQRECLNNKTIWLTKVDHFP